MTTPPNNKRKLGQAIDWTDADLDRLATVTPEDILAASALWRKNAGKLANLLDAKPVENNAKPAQPANA